MKRLSRSSERVYHELKETLKRQIELGELVQGQAVMAERKLGQLFCNQPGIGTQRASGISLKKAT